MPLVPSRPDSLACLTRAPLNAYPQGSARHFKYWMRYTDLSQQESIVHKKGWVTYGNFSNAPLQQPTLPKRHEGRQHSTLAAARATYAESNEGNACFLPSKFEWPRFKVKDRKGTYRGKNHLKCNCHTESTHCCKSHQKCTYRTEEGRRQCGAMWSRKGQDTKEEADESATRMRKTSTREERCWCC